jgi:hypothetical protein
MSRARDPAASTVRLLAEIYREVEMAGRPPGQLVTITRQTQEQILSDLREAGRLIRERYDE